MTYWSKSEKHPTFDDYRIERDVDMFFYFNSWAWGGDFPGDKRGYARSLADAHVPRGVTVSRTGPAYPVTVDKCTVCGRSVTCES